MRVLVLDPHPERCTFTCKYSMYTHQTCSGNFSRLEEKPSIQPSFFKTDCKDFQHIAFDCNYIPLTGSLCFDVHFLKSHRVEMEMRLISPNLRSTGVGGSQ